MGLNDIVPILQNMHSRLIELAEKEAKKHFDVHQWIQFNTKINELIGVHLTETKNEKEVKQEISRVSQEILAKIIGRNIIDLLPELMDKSALLDHYGWGLKERRRERQYKTLKKELAICRNKVSDDDLNDMIRDRYRIIRICS